MTSTYRVLKAGRLLMLATVWLLMFAGVARAQIRVEGVIRDVVGAPIANATVQLITEKRETVTDAEGRYHFDGVKAGQYVRLIVSVAGRTILQTYRLVTLAVEQIDLGVTPPPAPVRREAVDRDRSQWTEDRGVSEPQRPVLTEAQRKELGVGGSGGIRGVVRSADGLGIPGAVVAVTGTDVFATTDTEGKFTVVNLRPDARVALLVTAPGFEDRRQEAVVKTGAPESMDITLSVATQGEFVVVSAEVPMLKVSGETSHLTLRGGGPSRFGGGAFSSTPASWFYDVNAKADVDLTSRDKFSLSAYDGRDDLDNSRTLEIGRFTGGLPAPTGVTLPTIPSDLVLGISDVRNVKNQGAGASLSHKWGRAATTTLSAGWSKFRSTRQQSNQLTLSSTGEDYSLDSGRGGSGAQAESNALSDVTLRFDNDVAAGRSHRLSFGAEATSLDASYDAETAAVQGNGPGGFRSGLVGLLTQSGRGRLVTGYLQDTWSPTARLVLTGGLRVTKYDVTNDVFMEPRVRANLQVTSRLQFKLGYGGYHQAVNRIAQEDLSQGDREFWLLSNGTTVPVSTAKQIAGGFSYETPGFLVDVEAYHKRLDALTLFAPRLTPGVVPAEGDNYLYYGSGLARGLEALVQKKFGTHTGWLSYTMSRVEQTFSLLEPESFLATQDQTHELKVADSIKIREAWTMGASWIFGSGKPYTPATGVESVALPIGVTVDRLTFGAKNSARLPTYHRLDLSTQGDVHAFGVKGTLGLTVFNVYNRANVWYRSYQTFGGSGSVNDVTLMGRAINVFLKVGF